MIKHIIALLLVSGVLFGARLQTNATADTYLFDQASVEGTAGSFAIRMESTDAMTRITAAASTTNYGTATTGRIGYFSGIQDRWLLRWATLNDSMRTKATNGKIIRWDSARVVVTITTALTSGDYMVIGMYELRAARNFVESEATWEIYKASNNWGTVGAGNESSDIHTPSLDSSATLTSASTSMSFKIPGVNITDTLNNAGVVLRIEATQSNYDEATNPTVAAVIGSDDNATEGNRPLITVYYTEMEYPDYGGADTLLMKLTDPTTTHGFPVMTFDISDVEQTATIGACSLFFYVNANYSNNVEGTARITAGIGMKPTNIGTGTGGATATGKMNWGAWFENGSADSAWGTIGAGNMGNTCNRTSGSGNDKTFDMVIGSAALTGTGWKSIAMDTTGIRTYLDGSCGNNFAIYLHPLASLGDDAWYVLSSTEGANAPYLVINYTPGATAVTKGTGRFGRSQTGEYLNVR